MPEVQQIYVSHKHFIFESVLQIWMVFGFQIQNSIWIIEGLDNWDLYNWSPTVLPLYMCG